MMKNAFFLIFALSFLLSCSTSLLRQPAVAPKPRHFIITVHGLSGNENTWGHFSGITKNYLEQLDPKYDVHISNFLYPTGRTETLTTFDFANGLDKHIETLFEKEPLQPTDRISFVTHSQGGIVSYIWFFSRVLDERLEQKYIKNVDSIITLGTPFWGSKMASILTDKNTPDIVPLIKLLGGSEFLMSRRELLDLAYGSDTIDNFRRLAVKMDSDPQLQKKLNSTSVRLVNIIGVMPKDQRDLYATRDLNSISKMTRRLVDYVYKIFRNSESDIAVAIPSGRWNFIYSQPRVVTEPIHIQENEFKHFSSLVDRSKFLFTEAVHLPFDGDSTLSMAYINKSCDKVETCNHPTYRYVLEQLVNCRVQKCDPVQREDILQKMKVVNGDQHAFNRNISRQLTTFSVQISIKLAPGVIDRFPVRYFVANGTNEYGHTNFEINEPSFLGRIVNLHHNKDFISSASTPTKTIYIGGDQERRTVDIHARLSKNNIDQDVLRIHLIGSVRATNENNTEAVSIPLSLHIPGLPEVKIDTKIQPSYSTFVELDYSKYRP